MLTDGGKTMELHEIKAKLNALRNQVSKEVARGRHMPDTIALNFFDRYALIRDELKLKEPALFDDLPIRAKPKPMIDNGNLITLQEIRLLLMDIEYCLDVLSNMTTVDVPSMKVTREGVFFSGQYFDALLRVRDILAQAKKSIVIIDGYVNEDVLNLVSGKDKSVEVKILTKNVSASLNTAAIAFNKQYGNLSIRSSSVFHDRFVIIDNKEFYHFGASIKDLGNRGFMFSLIEESFVIDALRQQFNQEWANATVVI
jgi:hypothetical protein